MRVTVTVEAIRHQQHVLMRQRRRGLSHVNVQTMKVRIVAHIEVNDLVREFLFGHFYSHTYIPQAARVKRERLEFIHRYANASQRWH